jgi:NADH:ubiquinone oxidoreductase subunit E
MTVQQDMNFYCVLICQGRSCRKQGSAKVLEIFRSYNLTKYTIEDSGCLGQCGMGPMVLILPDRTWYDRVLPQEVDSIVQHLI